MSRNKSHSGVLRIATIGRRRERMDFRLAPRPINFSSHYFAPPACCGCPYLCHWPITCRGSAHACVSLATAQPRLWRNTTPLPQRTLATVPCFPTVGSLVTSVFARQRHPRRWEHHRYEAQCGLELVTPSDSFAPKPHKKYLEGGIAKMFARACNAAQQGGLFAKVVVLEALPRCKCPVIMRQKITD